MIPTASLLTSISARAESCAETADMPMTSSSQNLPLIERALRRDRAIVASALIVITVLAWAYLLIGAGTGMSVSAMSTWHFPPPRPNMAMSGPWHAGYWLVMGVMWFVMMVAMMIPSAAPMILLHARVTRHGAQSSDGMAAPVPTAAFTAGYLAAWLLFSGAATTLQWGLERAGLVDGMLMWSTEPVLTGALLVMTGLYQFTPLKTVCLTQCRSPVTVLSQIWKPGARGAFVMGVRHGSYCLGCCWALMLLLFAGGVMNVVWIAGLAILVLAEKLLSRGPWFPRLVGVVLIAMGVVSAGFA